MGPVPTWWHMTIVVNVVFEKVFTLTRLRHTVSSKRVTVNTKNEEISKIEMQMICDIPIFFGNWHSQINFIPSYLATSNPFLS